MFNVECCKLHDKFLGEWLSIFLRRTARKGGSIFLGGCDLHRNYGVVVILLFFLFSYDNLTLESNQKKYSYPDEGWFFTGRFKVGMSVGLEASKKCIKIHLEYDARPLIKSCNSY